MYPLKDRNNSVVGSGIPGPEIWEWSTSASTPSCLQSSCTDHQQDMWVLVIHSQQYLILSGLKILANLTGKKWYFTVAFNCISFIMDQVVQCFIYLWSFMLSFLWVFVHVFCSFFYWVLWFFLLTDRYSLFILNTIPLTVVKYFPTIFMGSFD